MLPSNIHNVRNSDLVLIRNILPAEDICLHLKVLKNTLEFWLNKI